MYASPYSVQWQCLINDLNRKLAFFSFSWIILVYWSITNGKHRELVLWTFTNGPNRWAKRFIQVKIWAVAVRGWYARIRLAGITDVGTRIYVDEKEILTTGSWLTLAVDLNTDVRSLASYEKLQLIMYSPPFSAWWARASQYVVEIEYSVRG